jgi:hypothetical protein
VVIPARRPAVASNPVARSPEISDSIESSRSTTPQRSRHATPESVAADFSRVSITPSSCGHSRGHSAPVNSPPTSPIQMVSHTLNPELQEIADRTLVQQQEWILTQVDIFDHIQFNEINNNVIFEHLMDPNVFELTRAGINDAIDWNHVQRNIRGNDLVPVTRYGRLATGISRMTLDALRVLYHRYRQSDRFRREMRYSSVERE